MHILRAGRILSFPQCSKNNSPDWSPSTSQISCVRHKPKLFWHISTDLHCKNGHWAIKICFAPLFSRQAVWLTGPFYSGKQILSPIFSWQKATQCHQFLCFPDWNFDLWLTTTLKFLPAPPLFLNGTITPLTNFCRLGTDFLRPHCLRLSLVTLCSSWAAWQNLLWYELYCIEFGSFCSDLQIIREFRHNL